MSPRATIVRIVACAILGMVLAGEIAFFWTAPIDTAVPAIYVRFFLTAAVIYIYGFMLLYWSARHRP